MNVQFIIDGSDFISLLSTINFVASNAVKVDHTYSKISGHENYILYLTIKDGIKRSSAIALSEIREVVESLFVQKHIKFYVVYDEASQFYAKLLYPPVMEFEVKLRKFLISTLFDIDDAKEDDVEIILSNNLYSGTTLSSDFYKLNIIEERATLENLNSTLFGNKLMAKKIESYLNSNRFATRQQLDNYIDSLRGLSLWEMLFAKNFSDSILPRNFTKVIEIRNDVMHFHRISEKKYADHVQILKESITDLDKQLSKHIVLENTNDEPSLLTFSKCFISTIVETLQSPAMKEISNMLSNIAKLLNVPVANVPKLAALESYEKNFYPLIASLSDLDNSPDNKPSDSNK